MPALYEPRRILVVVKTYPNPSQSHVETVCCAGVDLATGQWVRMYPITFRRLADRRFTKYQVITAMAAHPDRDSRPESLKIDQDTIRLVGAPLPAGDGGWRRRMAMLPPADRSLEQIHDAQRRDGTSLGMFRPKRIRRLVIRKAKPWTEKQKAALRQERLDLGERLTNELSELEQIPWEFAYEFTCDDDRCATGHTLQIFDWEIGQSYRSWFRSDPNGWVEKIRTKYEMELPARDLLFVVGNLAKRRRTFVIVGLVRPPRPQVNGGYLQQSLDLAGEQRTVARIRIGLETQQADTLPDDNRQEILDLLAGEEQAFAITLDEAGPIAGRQQP